MSSSGLNEDEEESGKSFQILSYFKKKFTPKLSSEELETDSVTPDIYTIFNIPPNKFSSSYFYKFKIFNIIKN